MIGDSKDKRKFKVGCIVFLAVIFSFFLWLIFFTRWPIIEIGPTDQGRSSATKWAMESVKRALYKFKDDVGDFPQIRPIHSPEGVNLASEELLGLSEKKNVLGSAGGLLWQKSVDGTSIASSSQNWNGPYIEVIPSDFFLDGWEKKYKYSYFSKAIYLQSAGPDATFNALPEVLNEKYTGDDIVLKIADVAF